MKQYKTTLQISQRDADDIQQGKGFYMGKSLAFQVFFSEDCWVDFRVSKGLSGLLKMQGELKTGCLTLDVINLMDCPGQCFFQDWVFRSGGASFIVKVIVEQTFGADDSGAQELPHNKFEAIANQLIAENMEALRRLK